MLSAAQTRIATGAAEIPLARLDYADPDLLDELMEAVRTIAERGAFTLGEPVEAFEREFAAYCETDHAVGVSSGTEALVLALRALEIGPGDEVIVPTNSFIATAEAVSAVGAAPRLVDIDPASHLMTSEILSANLGPRVRCVIPVHLFGATAAMQEIVAVARDAGIHVIEDACQAHGARHRGRRVGSFGELGCFSFYPTKNLGAWGDGGAVVTSSAELADRVRLLRAHGERPRYEHRIIGTTARLDAVQAAVLRIKLTRLEEWNTQRRELGFTLRALILDGLADAGLTGAVELADGADEHGDHVYHLFVARTDRREELREHLAAHDIASAVHYPTPIHVTDAYAGLGMRRGSLPVSERHAERMCTLPLYPAMDEEDAQRIAGAVVGFAEDQATRGR